MTDEIKTRCPSCGHQTLFIGSGGHLTCSLLGCKNPSVESAIESLTQERDALRECFREIETWAKAYPLNVFPEPDLKRAHEVLKAAGMTLDAISASSMRHVLNEVMEIAKRALAAYEGKEE